MCQLVDFSCEMFLSPNELRGNHGPILLVELIFNLPIGSHFGSGHAFLVMLIDHILLSIEEGVYFIIDVVAVDDGIKEQLGLEAVDGGIGGLDLVVFDGIHF